MRIDRLITLHAARPLVRFGRGRGTRIPILMYHSIAATGARCHPYYATHTAPDVFAEHMRLLHEQQYTVIRLSEASGILETAAAESPRTGDRKKIAVLTFDDGYRDFYDEAFGVLDRYGFTATVFLPTQYIGNRRGFFKGKECLSWSAVRELRRRGIDFGSHTVSHPQLRDLERSRVQEEIMKSRLAIETELGEAVREFSYPYRFPEEDAGFVAFLRSALLEAGYAYGVSTIVGTASRHDDPFFLKRIPVNSFDDPPLLLAKLEGAYDWMHGVQYSWKRLRSGLRRMR